MEKIKCPKCNELRDIEELEFIKEIGECIQCDHNRGEVMENLQNEDVFSLEEMEE